MVRVPEPLQQALDGLRPLLLDAGHLVRAVAGGRRRGASPAHHRAELRPVRIKAGARLQLVTTDGRRPTTRNLEPAEVDAVVAGLLAEPFGSWRVETDTRVVQLRVTKRGEAQVHVEPRATTPDPSHDRPPRHLLDPGDALFSVLGASAAKRRQVDAFLRLLAPAVEPAARAATEAGRPMRVLDLGCGNAYLTFAAHRYLSGRGPVSTLGVDERDDLVARNVELAGRLGAAGLEFVAGTIGATDLGRDADVVLALHACDTATDDALAAGVRIGAPVLLAAPCCHHDVQRQLAGMDAGPRALLRDGILAERFADVLTDAVRAALLRTLGYRVDVVEFVESRHTPRNTLLRAVRTTTPAPAAGEQYAQLLRAWPVRPALSDRLVELLDVPT